MCRISPPGAAVRAQTPAASNAAPQSQVARTLARTTQSSETTASSQPVTTTDAQSGADLIGEGATPSTTSAPSTGTQVAGAGGGVTGVTTSAGGKPTKGNKTPPPTSGGVSQAVVPEATPAPAPAPATAALSAGTQSYVAMMRERIARGVEGLNASVDKMNNLSGRISTQEQRLDRLRQEITGTSGAKRANIQANIEDAKLNIANLRELRAVAERDNAMHYADIQYVQGLIAPYGG